MCLETGTKKQWDLIKIVIRFDIISNVSCIIKYIPMNFVFIVVDLFTVL